MRAAESRAGSAIGAWRSTDTETVWTFDTSSTWAGTGDRGRENCDMGETTYKRNQKPSRKTVEERRDASPGPFPSRLAGLTFGREGGRVVAGDPVVHAGGEGAAGGLLRAGDGVLHAARPGRGAVGATVELHAHATGLCGPCRGQVEEERCDGGDKRDGVQRGALHAPRNCSCSVLPSIARVADLPFVATWVTSSK